MALGGDQGCSIRAPAHYCGIVGLKPTHGLVPYTGVMPVELTIDHIGPMARTVYDTALLLEVSGYYCVNFYNFSDMVLGFREVYIRDPFRIGVRDTTLLILELN